MHDRVKGKIYIRDELRKRDKSLYLRLEAIWVKAQELQERQRSEEGHQQGPLHCGTVEKNLDKLIPDDMKRKFFTPSELFLFSAAACYHDIAKSGDFKEEHGVVAMKDIFASPGKYGLIDPEGKVLSYIIGAHDADEVFENVPEISHLGNEDIRVKILSALFRLADVLHTDHSRISQIHLGYEKKEDEKTRFRNLITHIPQIPLTQIHFLITCA